MAETVSFADTILHNARIATQDERRSFASALAIRDGRFAAVGDERSVMALRGPATQVIDAGGRTVIPGLNDSHIHVIRGGLNYNMELRWDGVPSLCRRARACCASRPRARRRRSGCASSAAGREFQFAERRMPTLDEINAVSPDMPVFVLHLYDRALLNRAALRAVGYTRETPDPPGGEIAARQGRQPDRPADRPAERHDPLQDALARAAALDPDDAAQLHAPLHARAEPLRADQHHRRRRRLPELPRRLPGDRAAAPRRPADAALRLQPLHAETRARSSRTSRAGSG